MSFCENDDNNVQAPIVGARQPLTMKIYGFYNGMPFSQTYTANDCQKKDRAIFNVDGTEILQNWLDDTGAFLSQTLESYTYSYNTTTKAVSITTDGLTEVGVVNMLTATQPVYSTSTTYHLNGQNAPVAMEISANRQ